MSSNHYFDNELSYLDKLEQYVATEKPQLINQISEKVRDPDAARLLDGIAYLSGNLREQIDRQFPELTNSLVNMLWPAYARPFPSMTVMEYRTEPSQEHAIKIAKEQAFISRPLYVQNDLAQNDDDNWHQCQFTQCRDLWVLPMQITRITQNKDTLDIHFSLNQLQSLVAVGLEKLCIYLNGLSYTTTQLFYLLNSKIKKAKITTVKHQITLEHFSVEPIGFHAEDSLLPYPKNSYEGYRLLQEYFCFPEAFLSLAIKGLDNLPPALRSDAFTLSIQFECDIPEAMLITEESIKINCVPAVNLFKSESEAINLTGKETEYVLNKSHKKQDCYDIFSINTIQGWRYIPNQKSYITRYTAFESFHHQNNHENPERTGYYRLKIAHHKSNYGYQHTLSFVRNNEENLLNCEESISVSMNCTNRTLASSLSSHSIKFDEHTAIAGISSTSNIIKPTKALYPLLGNTLYWSELTNLSINYQSLLSLTALKQILQLYDFKASFFQQSARQSQKCLDAITDLKTESIEYLYKGLPVRGVKTTLSIHQNAFISEGAMYLFCSVLAQFFTLYTSVNMFHELEVINLDNKEIYLWPAKINQQILK
ncbi:type VI secretion system baseplate subunit TssF [Proteus vulgaris]|uniref:type VI secretion system baseplate subunit TssF n=1 Tax=Proteus vulgaris TaxID=585 RepID=UPI001FFEE365|nr:type VI secretion system baseplate subunit TssF [Proteus vulgaris]UPK80249.1 type VI secretion system baseplate subunit TssF [Proteus vulgaris]